MRIVFLAAAALAASASAAEAQPATRDIHPAPWWMRDAVMSSIGHVQMELPANRAAFSARFQAVARTAGDANTAAAEKARAFTAAVQGAAADRVRVSTELSTEPLYQQYRDKEGNLQDNERPDQIERYAATVEVAVEVRDVSLLQRAYNAALAARPTNVSEVEFALEPDNELKTRLYAAAVRDAARRAKLATEAAGAQLGAVRVIDASAQACRSDVLTGTTTNYVPTPRPTTVAQASDGSIEEVVVTSARRPSAPAGEAESPPPLPLSPPFESLTAQACVIYGLAG